MGRTSRLVDRTPDREHRDRSADVGGASHDARGGEARTCGAARIHRPRENPSVMVRSLRSFRVIIESFFGPVIRLGGSVLSHDGSVTPGPVPLFPGIRVENSSQGELWRVQFTVTAEPAEVLRFYARAFEERGLCVTRPEGRSDMLSATAAGVEAGAVAARGLRGETEGVVFWSGTHLTK